MNLDALARSEFGITKSQAHTRGVCIKCHKPPVFFTPSGRAEYRISGLCEPCFDGLWPEEPKE
jgi:hypothetical protein